MAAALSPRSAAAVPRGGKVKPFSPLAAPAAEGGLLGDPFPAPAAGEEEDAGPCGDAAARPALSGGGGSEDANNAIGAAAALRSADSLAGMDSLLGGGGGGSMGNLLLSGELSLLSRDPAASLRRRGSESSLLSLGGEPAAEGLGPPDFGGLMDVEGMAGLGELDASALA